MADSGFWWPEFLQLAFEHTLSCCLRRKKYLCLSIFLPLSSFEFPVYLRFIFITLFLRTVKVSNPNRINWMKQQHWIVVELLKLSSGFSLFLPIYWTPTVPFLNVSFSVPCYLCHCFPHSCVTETNKGYFWDENPNLLSCAFVYLLLASVKTQCGCHFS